jgi:plastocyanin
MKKSMIVTIVLVIALIGGGIAFFAMKNEDDSEKVTPQSTVTTSSVDTTTTAASSANVAIKDFVYTPSTITVKKGATVTWTNNDSMAHTVTTSSSSPETFDSGSIANGQTFSHVFSAVGTYSYSCSFHASMKATVIVTE